MIKNVTVNSTLTPEENLTIAERMVGQVVQAQPRWSPGSLVNSILSEASVALLVLVSATGVVALDNTGGSNIETALGGLAGKMEIFTASGDKKSKQISCVTVTVPDLALDIDAEFSFGVDHPLYQILAPTLPSFTLLSLVNAVETAMGIADGKDDYLIVADQITEKLYVVLADGPGVSGASFVPELIGDGGDFATLPVVAAFDTAIDASSPSAPSFGWE